ncbi:MAG: purine-nucleoside phosphorylase [Rikenellaceae bacterium]
MLEKIKNTASNIKSVIGDFTPHIGIILGSGLGDLVDDIKVSYIIEYKDITGFPQSTVEGHKGRLVFGELGSKKVVAMQGRFHFYEGYAPSEVVFPVRVLKFLGIEYLFVSNAAGGVGEGFKVGDLMVIDDHINLIPNPLIGKNIDELGPRFPDMNDAYNHTLRALAHSKAKELGISLWEGVYLGGTGPTYETRAEYKYFRAIGADAVGMSTTPEVIAARHMGVKVFGMSVITNIGLSGEVSTHEDVQLQGRLAGERLRKLFIEMLREI